MNTRKLKKVITEQDGKRYTTWYDETYTPTGKEFAVEEVTVTEEQIEEIKKHLGI